MPVRGPTSGSGLMTTRIAGSLGSKDICFMRLGSSPRPEREEGSTSRHLVACAPGLCQTYRYRAYFFTGPVFSESGGSPVSLAVVAETGRIGGCGDGIAGTGLIVLAVAGAPGGPGRAPGAGR